jgi:pseudouridine-5'-phosphate glycosidase
MHSQYLLIHPEVQQALTEKKPVVALESTIISHGMPYPQNVKTALEVETVIREGGAIPATIAILDGKLCVGLNDEQLEKLGKAGHDAWKVSLRDMPYVLSQKIMGATTVAATMRIASMAEIRVFVTGGIGGVHRGAEDSMDISADLTEMAQTSVAVVSAGVKSILDIGRTLEYLETLGIPVVTYGQSAFPSFYSSKSGFQTPLRMDAASDIAAMLKAKWDIGLNGSVLVANPVPSEFEVAQDEIEQHILKALAEASRLQISGKNVTPFLLKTIAENTGGESLDANIALVKNNAALGSAIAVAFSEGESKN